jgi:hypothetical protein
MTDGAPFVMIKPPTSKFRNTPQTLYITCNCTADARGSSACLFHGFTPQVRATLTLPLDMSQVNRILSRLGMAFHSPRRTLAVSFFDMYSHMLTPKVLEMFNAHMLWSPESIQAFSYAFDAADFRGIWTIPAIFFGYRIQSILTNTTHELIMENRIQTVVRNRAVQRILETATETGQHDIPEIVALRTRFQQMAIDCPIAELRIPQVEGMADPRVQVKKQRPKDALREILRYCSGSLPGTAPPPGARKRGRPKKVR